MADISNIRSKSQDRIYNQFPPVEGSDIPQEYTIIPIESEKERITKFAVYLWHRLLKNIYRQPTDLECELRHKDHTSTSPIVTATMRILDRSRFTILGTTRENCEKVESGELKLYFANWKYFIYLPSGSIVEVGTKNRTTSIHFGFLSNENRPVDRDKEDASRFISLLLDEADKSATQLFDARKRFYDVEALRSCILLNVYLSNYRSGELMLRTAVTQEQRLHDDFHQYDARPLDLSNEELGQIDYGVLVCGTYFSSAIMYFYMALEGFINIVFHSFLKKTMREGPFKNNRFAVEEKISDIALKLRLLPVMCDGFKDEHLNATSDVYANFGHLTKYRNSIFHSKIEDTLKSAVFVEDMFEYQCQLDQQFLPSFKLELTIEDVRVSVIQLR